MRSSHPQANAFLGVSLKKLLLHDGLDAGGGVGFWMEDATEEGTARGADETIMVGVGEGPGVVGGATTEAAAMGALATVVAATWARAEFTEMADALTAVDIEDGAESAADADSRCWDLVDAEADDPLRDCSSDDAKVPTFSGTSLIS